MDRLIDTGIILHMTDYDIKEFQNATVQEILKNFLGGQELNEAFPDAAELQNGCWSSTHYLFKVIDEEHNGSFFLDCTLYKEDGIHYFEYFEINGDCIGEIAY